MIYKNDACEQFTLSELRYKHADKSFNDPEMLGYILYKSPTTTITEIPNPLNTTITLDRFLDDSSISRGFDSLEDELSYTTDSSEYGECARITELWVRDIHDLYSRHTGELSSFIANIPNRKYYIDIARKQQEALTMVRRILKRTTA